MEDVEFVGQSSYSIDSAEFKDGIWTIKRSVVQSRTKDFKEWDNRKYEVMAMDVLLEEAHKTAMRSMVNKLTAVGFDLFTLEPDSEIKAYLTKAE